MLPFECVPSSGAAPVSSVVSRVAPVVAVPLGGGQVDRNQQQADEKQARGAQEVSFRLGKIARSQLFHFITFVTGAG
jgi:hypothetical protein